MRPLAAALASLGAVLVAPPALGATVQLGVAHDVAAQPIASLDGAFAFKTAPAQLIYGSTADGSRRTLRLEAPTCLPRAGSGSSILISCEPGGTADRPPRILDVHTGTISTPAAAVQPTATSFSELGAHWIGGQQTTREAGRVFISRHDGTLVERPAGYYDLNSPELAPIRRPAAAGTTTWAFRGTTVLRTRRRTGDLELVRHGRVRILSRCRVTCRSASLSARYAAWTEGRRVHRARLSDGAQRSWRFRSSARTPQLAVVAQNRALIAAVPYRTGDTDSRVFALR